MLSRISVRIEAPIFFKLCWPTFQSDSDQIKKPIAIIGSWSDALKRIGTNIIFQVAEFYPKYGIEHQNFIGFTQQRTQQHSLVIKKSAHKFHSGVERENLKHTTIPTIIVAETVVKKMAKNACWQLHYIYLVNFWVKIFHRENYQILADGLTCPTFRPY